MGLEFAPEICGVAEPWGFCDPPLNDQGCDFRTSVKTVIERDT